MSKKSLTERLRKKRDELRAKSEKSGNIVFIKEGTIRIRILPIEPDQNGEDQDFSWEIPHFYLGQDIKGVISPSAIGLPCPILEKQKELAKSSDPDDKDLAKMLTPRTRHLIPVLIYKDESGKNPDPDSYGKLLMLTNSLMSQIYDYYLDPEWGDLTDPIEGYDLKITRKGSGKTDTEYTVMPMKTSRLPDKYAKPINLRKKVEEVIPSYKEVEEKLNQFLGISNEDTEDLPVKRVKKVKKVRE